VQQPNERELAENAAFAEKMFGSDVPDVDLARAFEATVVRRRLTQPAWTFRAAGLAVAAGLIAALLFTPLGGYATGLLTIFEPKGFVPLAISARDTEQLRLMPRLTDFGTFRSGSPQTRRVASLAAATDLLGFSPRRLDPLPPGPYARVQHFVLLASTVSFTFSAAKAQAYENHFQRHLPPMPPGLDGATIRVTIGPGILTTYGNVPKDLKKIRHSDVDSELVFVQSKAPRITSSGASMQDIESYLLSMPNVPADVAAQLRAISNPSAMLPVPFEIDKANATPVEVDGVSGLAIGDQTGLGSGVLWRKDRMIYAIGGSMKESDVLALANGLK
jgi:hypothetical protein